MLRRILGDDEKSQLLIPPLHPGQGLPRELLEFSHSCPHLRGERRSTSGVQWSSGCSLTSLSSAELDDSAEDRRSADPKAAADLSRRISQSAIAVVTKGEVDIYLMHRSICLCPPLFCPLTSCLSSAGSSTTLGPLTPAPSAVSDPEHRGGVIIVYGAPLAGPSP